jgi:GDPmannose 4,6-dehydratase
MPGDFVIASNEAHSLEDFVGTAFADGGLALGEHVKFDRAIAQPIDIAHSLANPSKAKAEFGWQRKVRFREIVSRIVRDESEGAAVS